MHVLCTLLSIDKQNSIRLHHFCLRMAAKRKRTELTLAQKYEIVCESEAGKKASDVAQKFQIDRSTISKLMKKKDEIQAAFQVRHLKLMVLVVST
jgi:transcriptional regulator with XRE-family HTH domain